MTTELRTIYGQVEKAALALRVESARLLRRGAPESNLHDATRFYEELGKTRESLEEATRLLRRLAGDEDRREPTTVYVAILEGDNFDTEAEVFDDLEDAVHHVRGPILEACTRHNQDGPETEEVTEAMENAGWVYYARAFDDGPKGRVVRKDLA